MAFSGKNQRTIKITYCYVLVVNGAALMASQTVAIRIPKLNVDTKVIEIYLSNSSWDISSLDQNVGHLEGTPDFQTQDNVVLTGYSQTADGEPGVFANLPTLSSGDEV